MGVTAWPRMHFRSLLPSLLSLGLLACGTPDTSHREWKVYLGDPGSSQYSALDQINRTNVQELQVAWVFHTGDKREDNRSQIQCSPIVVDGVLYATSPQLKVFALNASTGENLWTFDPFKETDAGRVGVNRFALP